MMETEIELAVVRKREESFVARDIGDRNPVHGLCELVGLFKSDTLQALRPAQANRGVAWFRSDHFALDGG
jgi:hypothetical protein